MKPSTYKTIGHEQITSADSSTTATATIPTGTSAIILSVETTNTRITFDGATPGATEGHVYPKDQTPVFIPVGPGTTIKARSTDAATDGVVNLTYLQ